MNVREIHFLDTECTVSRGIPGNFIISCMAPPWTLLRPSKRSYTCDIKGCIGLVSNPQSWAEYYTFSRHSKVSYQYLLFWGFVAVFNISTFTFMN